MSNSFKNLQKAVNDLRPNEPKRREQALTYIQELTKLVHESFINESTTDYMFLKTLYDATKEAKHFGGFTSQSKKDLLIIEKRYNYIYEEGSTNIE